jgi:phage-related protein
MGWRDNPESMRPLFWVGSSKKDLIALPGQVKDVFGYALFLAQLGRKHDQAKPLAGFGSAGVIEIIENEKGNAYRGVYTVRFASGIYVLHVFQNKSKRGIATPKADMELIKDRLSLAQQIHKELLS